MSIAYCRFFLAPCSSSSRTRVSISEFEMLKGMYQNLTVENKRWLLFFGTGMHGLKPLSSLQALSLMVLPEPGRTSSKHSKTEYARARESAYRSLVDVVRKHFVSKHFYRALNALVQGSTPDEPSGPLDARLCRSGAADCPTGVWGQRRNCLAAFNLDLTPDPQRSLSIFLCCATSNPNPPHSSR